MGRCLGRFIDPGDLAVRSDQKGHAFRPILIRAFRRAIGHGDRAGFIEQQMPGQPMFFRPFLQIFRRAEGDADQNRVFVFKVRGSITEPIGFVGSPAAEGAGEKPYQHVFAGLIRQAHRFPILIGEGECGRCRADLKNSHNDLLSTLLPSRATIAGMVRRGEAGKTNSPESPSSRSAGADRPHPSVRTTPRSLSRNDPRRSPVPPGCGTWRRCRHSTSD